MTYEEVKFNYYGIIEFLHQMGEDYQKNFDAIQKTVVYQQQAVGGECMNRGYYCPSTTLDIIVGNISRGRIVKQNNKKSIDYTYGLDEFDRVVTAIKHTKVGNYYEYIVYNDNIQYSATFHFNHKQEAKLYKIAKCCYSENRLKSYEYYTCESNQQTFREYFGEFYDYSETEMEVRWVHCINGFTNTVYEDWYRFLIEGGYLKEYICKDGDKYLVTKKRKIAF